jgi:3-hydroxypropanoate dehydrogenase
MSAHGRRFVDAMTAAPQTALALSAEAQDLLFREARTANAFTEQPVGDDAVRAIYDLVKFGPTSMNNQPLRVALVQSDGAREQLLKHMAEGNRDKTANAPLVAVLAADTEFHENLPRVFPHFPQAKEMFTEPGAREDVARFNAALQVGYFLLGVRAAGLAAGPMTGFDPSGVDADLFADRTWRSLCVVNIGYPADNAWSERLPRLDHDEVVTSL